MCDLLLPSRGVHRFVMYYPRYGIGALYFKASLTNNYCRESDCATALVEYYRDCTNNRDDIDRLLEGENYVYLATAFPLNSV